jgi:hypothetical protein
VEARHVINDHFRRKLNGLEKNSVKRRYGYVAGHAARGKAARITDRIWSVQP